MKENAREKLIEELRNLKVSKIDGDIEAMDYFTISELGNLADFIFERDKKILEPLVKEVEKWPKDSLRRITQHYVIKTLNNAGLGE